MLYLPSGSARVHRLHAPFVTEKEIAAVVEFWKAQAQAEYIHNFLEAPKDEREAGAGGVGGEPGQDGEGESDPMYGDAVKLVVEFGKASTSLLQRRLRIGYGRAAHLIDLMDVEDSASIAAAAEKIESQLDGHGLDGLVNCAGIGMVRPVEYATLDDLRKIFEINVFGQLAVTQSLSHLLKKNRGRIVNVTSVGVNIAIPFGGLLNASKSAFAMLSDSLRLELHPFGVRVIAVEPGAIATPAVGKTLGDIEGVIGALPAEAQAQYGDMNSQGRPGEYGGKTAPSSALGIIARPPFTANTTSLAQTHSYRGRTDSDCAGAHSAGAGACAGGRRRSRCAVDHSRIPEADRIVRR